MDARIPYGTWWLTRQLIRRPGWFIRLGNFETNLFEEQLAGIAIDRPIFICGLARAGTTITLELLAGLPDMASFRYRDFPGVHLPLAWNRALGGDRRDQMAAVERLHGDGIEITAESPEALDEPIWMSFFRDAHDPARSSVLESGAQHPAFERFYRHCLQKLLLLRQGRRIVLKGNYLISRLGYLARLFPDARFVLLVRDPVEHIGSLMRQQVNFAGAAGADPRVLDYLRALGHFEFGLDRRPINFGDDAGVQSVLTAWTGGNEVEGWALYWRQVYGYLADLLEAQEPVRRAALVVRFEALHADPRTSLDAILDHCGLAVDEAQRAALAARLHAPASHKSRLGDAAAAQIHALCDATAARFGYPPGGDGGS
jgi:Sulfotransferase family